MANPRIISGKARGIRLRMVPGDITRPVTDIVKEAFYNILGTDIIDATMLDLFAGTGSVGIEALSRGAAYCRFTDLHHAAVETVKTNLELTRLKDQAQVIQTDALTYLNRTPDRAFDYIYIAPPQYKGIWERALLLVDKNAGWLTEEGCVVVQIDPNEFKEVELVNLELTEERKYGNTLLLFYDRKSSENQS